MKDKIREEIEALFQGAPDTQEARELKEEMTSNAEEKYSDLLARGFSEEQAYTMVMASIGDVKELLEELKIQNGAAKDPEGENPEGKRSEYWEKSAEYWKWQGEYIEKQAKNIGHQAKDAIDTIMASGIWDNISSSIKQIISTVGMSMQTEEGEYTDKVLYNERHFSPDGITEIVAEIQNSPVDLEVHTTTDGDILIQEYYNKAPLPEQKLEYSLVGGQLKLQYGTRVIGIHRRGVIKMYLPESLADSLSAFSAITASGDIALDKLGAAKQTFRTASGDIVGVIASGDITFNTASGDVNFNTICGNCQVRTASGDVSIKQVTGTITQSSASGDVEIEILEGDGTFHTASGDIEVTVTDAARTLECGAASGDVEVTLPAGASVQMTLNTGSGDISTFCDGIHTDEHVDYVKHGKHAVGNVGAEPYLQLRVTTASGDIEIKR